MIHLDFEFIEGADGVTSIEAVASTHFERHAAVMAEANAVLDWAMRTFPDSRGPVDEGFDWDDDLLVQVEDGGWHTVSLTLTGSARFVDAFQAKFAVPR